MVYIHTTVAATLLRELYAQLRTGRVYAFDSTAVKLGLFDGGQVEVELLTISIS